MFFWVSIPRSPLGASFESTSEKLKDLQPGEVLEMLEGPRKVPLSMFHGMGWDGRVHDVDGMGPRKVPKEMIR